MSFFLHINGREIVVWFVRAVVAGVSNTCKHTTAFIRESQSFLNEITVSKVALNVHLGKLMSGFLDTEEHIQNKTTDTNDVKAAFLFIQLESQWVIVNGFSWKTYPSPLKCYFPTTSAN